MSEQLPANYIFLPWVRQGAASGIQTEDMKEPNQAAIVSVKIKLQVNNTPPEVERQVRLYGPGDVIGIDPQQVVRTEPRHLSTDFEPNYFPAIEFDRPDFPWLFTPAAANSANRLRPWLCLIVVKKQDGVTFRVDRNLPLPVLEIKGAAKPGDELPDLSESWAWAHAQVAGTDRDQTSLRSSLADKPALTVSRLLCPRRLDPLTDYLACVVPTFELGRRAGLGQQILPADEQPPLGLAPSWIVKVGPPAEAPTEVILPVYFHWEFRTGIGGDFESLVGLLKAHEMPSTVGKRPIDLTNPGFKIDPPPAPGAKGTTLGLEGALRVVDSKPDEWPDDVRLPFQKALQTILNVSWDVATKESDNHDPVVGPPLYGCWQAARHTVNITTQPGAALNWLDELNLDPRHRVTAAMGTKVIQTEQEDLMASAWEQLGEIERVNQMKRQAQFGRAVNAVYHTRHFSQFSDATLLKVLAPAQSRLVVEPVRQGDTRALLSTKISKSTLPDNAVSTPLRRLTSTRGIVSTRFTTAGTQPLAVMGQLSTMAAFTVVTTFSETTTTLNLVSQSQTTPAANILKPTVAYERILPTLDSAPKLGNFTIAPEGTKRNLLNFAAGADSPDAAMFRKVAKANQEQFGKLFAAPATALAPVFNLFDVNIKTKLLESVDPEKTITARVQAALSTNGNQSNGDPLESIMDAPTFPQPMYEALRDLSQDFLLPGLETVPANTVTLLEVNPEFVESFMVGLNAEMSSELLWRNYPTDQRGTYFRQFWDATPDPNKTDQRDIQPITNWKDRHLGENSPNTSGKLVLLIRGELLRRYPNSVIYAVRAVKFKNTLDLSRDPKDERHPIFRGTLKPDVTFLGFNLSDAEALGQPPNDTNGFFFVIQQQPTEPAFGLDIADFAKPLPDPPISWNDLSWRHFAKTEAELQALSHVSISKVFPEIDNVTWGKNSAHQAFITLQRPVRIAIHAKQMIKE
ncbi:MAG TPA: hypothetical protein VFI24_16180 [Pyrinomonadaceae bacterium]|nr:hypothetical protein [Pyrinomonadaceae bacterium]